jgi:lipoprotein-releasing system permease protein
MRYALDIGWRYLRAKKRSTISVITGVSVTGVALGVAALLGVMSITAGFEQEFRDKVLGVNAHVLVLRYGMDFADYREVVERARARPEVAGAAPFEIDEMMLAKGDRLSGVLVKGIDPTLAPEVLDLPSQITAGSLEGLRLPGSGPPLRPEDLEDATPSTTDDILRELARDGLGPRDFAALDEDGDAGAAGADDGRAARHCAAWDPDCTPLAERLGADGGARVAQRAGRDAGTPGGGGSGGGSGEAPADDGFVVVERLPDAAVMTPEQMQALLAGLGGGDDAPDDPAGPGETRDGGLSGLPTDEQERAYVEQMEAEAALRARQERLPGIVVGVTLARNLGLTLGDEVRVISPLAGLDTALWRPGGSGPKSKTFRVIGIFEAGFQEYDTRLVYVDLYQAQALADRGDTVTGVEIRLHDLDEAHAVARSIEAELGGGPYHTLDWMALNHNLFTALEIQKITLSLVIAVIIFVAAFNVVATLIMVVLEKKREIAILKAMGAKDGAILGIFVLQGTVVGLVGTAIGLAIGSLLCWYLLSFEFPLDPKVYLIDHLPVRVSPIEFAWTAGIAFVICVTATLAPSWWAARLLPADGVRYE